jgi:8-oxo-dGTP pyrophosphatase MutT (NUDIX family)
MVTQLQTLSRLSDLVEPGTTRASSLLLVNDGRFLLAVRPPMPDRDRIILRLTGIGGWSEGEETFAATAMRESIEETGNPVRLLDLDRTLIVRSPDDMHLLEVSNEVAPAALVYRRFGTAPFDPWSASFQWVAPVAVYAGVMDSRVRIVAQEEHPLFMWVYPEQMIALADTDEPLEFLLNDGAELIGPVDFDPQLAIVRLTDSIQALVSALGSGAFSFLCDIARLTQPARVE